MQNTDCDVGSTRQEPVNTQRPSVLHVNWATAVNGHNDALPQSDMQHIIAHGSQHITCKRLTKATAVVKTRCCQSGVVNAPSCPLSSGQERSTVVNAWPSVPAAGHTVGPCEETHAVARAVTTSSSHWAQALRGRIPNALSRAAARIQRGLSAAARVSGAVCVRTRSTSDAWAPAVGLVFDFLLHVALVAGCQQQP